MKYIILLMTAALLSSCTRQTKKSESMDLAQAPISQDRFQLIQLGTMRRDQYLLDKQTGQLWAPTCLYGNKGADCEYSVWMKQEVEEINISRKDITAWVQQLEDLKKNRK